MNQYGKSISNERRFLIIVNTQFKKGVLELIVLKSIYHKDLYGYQLVTKINNVVDVNEGTIYRFTKAIAK